MNDDQELSEAQEESHYYSVLTDMVELMSQHGSKQVMMDLLELSMQYETVSTSINQLLLFISKQQWFSIQS